MKSKINSLKQQIFIPNSMSKSTPSNMKMKDENTNNNLFIPLDETDILLEK